MRQSWTFGALLILASCVGGRTHLSTEDRERLKPYILDAVPAGVKTLDINVEDKAHLLGVRVEPELAGPGATVKLTYYWRSDALIEEGFRLFTHVQHEGYDHFEGLDDIGPLRQSRGNSQVLGPDRWERGKIYADEQTLTMPTDLRGPESVVYLGIYKGNQRLRILSGPNDGDGRALVAKVRTGVAARPVTKRAPNEVPELRALKLAPGEKLTIDGKADDKEWITAASTGAFVDVMTGRPNTSFPVNGSARVLWDDERVYFLIEVQDPDVIGYFTSKAEQPNDWTATGQPMTWTRHTSEIMIDPDGDGDNVDYYEIQINPQNMIFKSQFDNYNLPKVEPLGPFGHEDWEPRIKSAVVVKGTIDKPGDKDEGYVVEAEIPWKAFSKGAKELPPRPGTSWRVNLYAMANNGGTAWSPILGKGNFHRASRFGRIVWATKEWLASEASDTKPGLDAGARDASAHDASSSDASAKKPVAR